MIYKVTLNDKLYEVEVEKGEAILVNVSDAPVASAAPVAPAAAVAPAAPIAALAAPVAVVEGELVSSPLPGSIMAIKVSAGESVKKGQVLILIEAMKMENEVLAPRDGVVKQIITSKGATVETDAPLLTLA